VNVAYVADRAHASVDGEADPRAIAAIDVVKDYHTEVGTRRVLDHVNFRVGAGERLGILGRNGAGKSTLIRLIAGLERPTSGRIHRGLRMSWPLALDGGFDGDITGYDNIRFISRLYHAPFREVFDYVADFSEIGGQLHMPIRFYSSGMRMRLAFALSLAMNFECLLIDEVIVVGDARFQQKCHREIFELRQDRTLIMAVHNTNIVKEYCTSALVLVGGRGRVFDDVNLATEIYATL